MNYLLWCEGFTVMILLNSTFGTTDTKHQTLAKSFYLPNRNIIEDEFIGGSYIFKNPIPAECIEQTKPGAAGKTSSNMMYYKDTKSFCQQFGASLGLSATLSSSFMLDSALKYVAGVKSNSSVSGMSLHVKSTKAVKALSHNCINEQPLSHRLIEDFDRLPNNISHPKAYSSWAPYRHFLGKYGSHMVTEVVYGSQLVQWEFSETSSKLSEKQLKAKACLDLFGAIPNTTVLGMCANFSREELNSAENVYSKKKLTVAGGSADTQANLREEKTRTDEVIAQLLKEGKGGFAGPIGYKWIALYDILLQRYSYGDRNIKARNLQIYFEGMKNYGCEAVKEGGTMLREFVSTGGHGNQAVYACRVPGEGCRADSDCHFKFGSIGCYCYGRTCIDKVVFNVGGEPKEERVIRRHRRGKYNVGVNKSCKLRWLSKCACQKERLAPELVTVWSSESGTRKVGARSAFVKPKTSKKLKKQQESVQMEEEGSGAISPHI